MSALVLRRATLVSAGSHVGTPSKPSHARAPHDLTPSAPSLRSTTPARSQYVNSSYAVYNDLWEALDSGPCPAGHYCPAGTEDPVQCHNATVR